MAMVIVAHRVIQNHYNRHVLKKTRPVALLYIFAIVSGQIGHIKLVYNDHYTS